MHHLSETIERKFEDIVSIEDGWCIETDTGWQPVSKVMKTVPYEEWELILEDGTSILAADDHIVFVENYKECFVKDLVPGQFVITDHGLVSVLSCLPTGRQESMYDIQVDSHDHRYYAGGILHHNTTCAAAFLLWKAMFEPDTTILIAANKYNAALEIMDRIRFAYENLEEYNWLRSGVTEYNKGTIKFDNGSKIVSRATSKDAGRGLSISLLYLDEFAFVQPSKAAEFWSAISPTLATGGSCIITSTPNSDEDQFAQIWFSAINNINDNGEEIPNGVGRNGYKPICVTWRENPERDQAWADEQLMQLGRDRFLREYECKFVSEDETLINPMTLTGLKGVDPLFKIGQVRWYAEPVANHVYGVALDPSMGTGGDYAALQIFDLTSMTQVGEWRDNKTTTVDQVDILRKCLLYIYQSLMNNVDHHDEPEIYWTVENNSLGEATLVQIEHIGEENFPGFFVSEPKRSGGLRGRKGLTTTTRSKLSSCAKLKSLIESRRMTIKSKALVSELKGFVRGGGSYKAKPGLNDDLVLAALSVVRLVQIVANWDDSVNDAIHTVEEEEDYEAPMPVIL